MIKQCVVCGKDFECKKSTALYCSRPCQEKARAERKKNNALLWDVDRHCLICGQTFRPRNWAANQRLCCYDCMPEGVQLSRSDFLNLIRKSRGGKCQRCGYDICQGALEFHHIEQSEKDFTIGNRDFKLKDCIEESKKCVLLCANCHREIHAGLWNLDEIKDKINGINE